MICWAPSQFRNSRGWHIPPACISKRDTSFLSFSRPWWFFYVDNTCSSRAIGEPVEHIVNEDPVLVVLLVSIIHIDVVQMNLKMKVRVLPIDCPDLFLPRQPRISTLGALQWKLEHEEKMSHGHVQRQNLRSEPLPEIPNSSSSIESMEA